jgi:two-component system sporulation sensor kinase A
VKKKGIVHLRIKYIVPLYVFVSLCWITLTDLYISHLSLSQRTVMFIQMAKGWIFVALSAFFIYMALKNRQALKRMAESEQELLTLIHAMPDFVCFKDGQGRWLKVNEFGRKLYQLEHVDYKGKTDRELAEYSPYFKEAFLYCERSDEEAWKAKTITRSEESFPVPSGEVKTFDVIKVPLFYENGKRKGLVTIGRDITQQKTAEALLLKREKLSVVGELAAGIAHEIRNPLTSIKGFIQMMKETKQVNDSYVTIILKELERINQIVGELLVLSKPQMKSYRAFRLNEVLNYVTSLIAHQALLQNVTIECSNWWVNPIIYGERNELIQVFINILKNALEAMPNGGTIRINVAHIEQDRVKITVSDTGKGIERERLNKLGEPFYTLKEKGMGLGLTISTKIIQEHKGSLQIESEVGKGTKVYIILPIYKEVDNHEGPSEQ